MVVDVRCWMTSCWSDWLAGLLVCVVSISLRCFAFLPKVRLFVSYQQSNLRINIIYCDTGLAELLKACVFLDSLGIAGCASLNDSGIWKRHIFVTEICWTGDDEVLTSMLPRNRMTSSSSHSLLTELSPPDAQVHSSIRLLSNIFESINLKNIYAIVCAFGFVAQCIVECQCVDCRRRTMRVLCVRECAEKQPLYLLITFFICK